MNTPEEKEVPKEQLLWPTDWLDKELDKTLYYNLGNLPDFGFKFKLSGVAVVEPTSQHVIYPFV